MGLTENVYLTLGSKFLVNDFTGFEFEPSARLAYYPSGNQTLWAAVSRAVRLPTRSEVGATVYNQNSNVVINQGNPQFQAEELIAYEAGYKVKPTRKTLIDAAVFYNQYSRLRTFESLGSTNVRLASPTTENYGYGESYGAEVTGRWQVNDDWKLEANYDFLSVQLHIQPYSTDNISKVALVNSLEVSEGITPQSQFKLKSFYNISPKWEFDSTAYYVGGLTKGGVSYKDRGIPSYIRIDTRLGYLPNRNWDLSVAIQNLFNQVHSEFTNGLYNTQTVQGRTFYFKVVWLY
jgi:iron complex outermembrane receptor protein